LPVTVLGGTEHQRARTAITAGLLVAVGDRLVLTDRGRLLADAVVRDLLDD
jgi:oxygen-independent coproporphyrinogen-3 oxidase